jgi:hypothetical protein
MTPVSVKRKLQTVSCPASPTANTLTAITKSHDLIYLKPGSSDLTIFSTNNFFTNSQSTCTTNECIYTFKDLSGNFMIIPKYIGTQAFNTNSIPSNLSGEWVGYISCRTDS